TDSNSQRERSSPAKAGTRTYLLGNLQRSTTPCFRKTLLHMAAMSKEKGTRAPTQEDAAAFATQREALLLTARTSKQTGRPLPRPLNPRRKAAARCRVGSPGCATRCFALQPIGNRFCESSCRPTLATTLAGVALIGDS